MMTKKHFNELATIIARQMSNCGTKSASTMCIAIDIADMCKRNNPNFDKERFLNACNFYVDND